MKHDDPFTRDQVLHYLRSIKSMVDAYCAEIKHGPTLAGEVAYDNRNWLDNYIDFLERAVLDEDVVKLARLVQRLAREASGNNIPDWDTLSDRSQALWLQHAREYLQRTT